MVQRIRDMEPSQRPRERLLEYGPTVLSDAELLAVLLRTGRRDHSAVAIAQQLLAEAGGLAQVARLDTRELTSRPGVGPAKAATLSAALELGHRLARAELRQGQPMDRPQAAADYLVRKLQGRRREEFGFLALDGRNRLVGEHRLTAGTRTQAPVDAAELFREALLRAAVSVVLYHNHPSGDVDPSRDDLALTRRLSLAGEVVGVRVADHLIVAGARWLSLRTARPDLFAPAGEGRC